MKLSELMKGITPNPEYAGIANTDDFVLAVDIAESASPKKADYVVVQTGVTAVDAQLNPETEDKTYLRTGKSTNKTATQRTFNITGDRFEGDAFQDFACGHAIKFGKGQKIVYLRTGKSTNKTATQRTFNITGDRFEGDAFQDFACGHAIKFGKGQKIVKPYVYFSMLTGKGEAGQAAIIVNSDGSGDAGAAAEVDIDIMCNSSAPKEYTYADDSAGG